jgi:hypothetical protein
VSLLRGKTPSALAKKITVSGFRQAQAEPPLSSGADSLDLMQPTRQ